MNTNYNQFLNLTYFYKKEMLSTHQQASEDIKFEGYKQHLIQPIQQFRTETFSQNSNEKFIEDVDFATDNVKLQQIDARLKNLEVQFARLCKDADRAVLNGMTDDDVYQVSGGSYQQAKINGIKYQFEKLQGNND